MFDAFLPDLATDRWVTLREPIPVPDPTDPYGSHLSGLALSRAWAWAAIAAALPAGTGTVELARAAADVHREAGWRYVFGYGYAAEQLAGHVSRRTWTWARSLVDQRASASSSSTTRSCPPWRNA